MRPLHFRVLPNGRLPDGIRETLKRVIPEYAGQYMTLELKQRKEKRNLDQNAFYWGVIIPEVRKYKLEQGDAMCEDEIHEELLNIFAPRQEKVDMMGNPYNCILRSSKMDVQQFSLYCTAIIAKMAEFGHPIPQNT